MAGKKVRAGGSRPQAEIVLGTAMAFRAEILAARRRQDSRRDAGLHDRPAGPIQNYIFFFLLFFVGAAEAVSSFTVQKLGLTVTSEGMGRLRLGCTLKYAELMCVMHSRDMWLSMARTIELWKISLAAAGGSSSSSASDFMGFTKSTAGKEGPVVRS